MLYSEFNSWLIRNKPDGVDDDDFRDFCALCGVLTIQNTLKNSDMTVSDLMDRFFNGNCQLSN